VRKIGKAEETQVKRMNLIVPIELHNNFKSVICIAGQKHDRRTAGVHPELRRQTRRHATEEG
jgi:hypothetical protein